MKRLAAVAASFSFVAGCGGEIDVWGDVDSSAPLAIFTTPDTKAVVDAYIAPLERDDVGVGTSDDPVRLMRRGGTNVRVALVRDLDCGECYRVDGAGAGRAVVHAGGTLGLQYGLSELLEGMGFRFFHPQKIHAPSALSLGSLPSEGRLVVPTQTTRGLQLHTLHPIEAMYDFWMPGEDHLARAKRTIDWLVKNRGNFVHWLTLDDIDDPEQYAAWSRHTKAINDYAHLRGVRTSIGLQLFGTASLQRSWILARTPSPGFEEDLEPSLAPIVRGMGFDHLGLSFGEFSSAPPEAFIRGVDETYAALQRLAPGMTMSGTIHVGGDLTVEYQGKEVLYYFLVQYARPEVLPWVHTVFYYNLFEDAGGAYQCDDFSTHREFLLGRLAEHKPVNYHPESAYWISFDNTIPMYLPLYGRSRWLDLHRIDEERKAFGGAPLVDHVLFSSGWEWGYWLTDVMTLRMGVELPGSFGDAVAAQFSPYGISGLSDKIVGLAELQHDALIVHRLAPYLAGRDEIMDLGKKLGKISQPDRPSWDELLALPEADFAEHEDTIARLVAFADANAALADELEALALPTDPFLDELRDGFAIDVARSRFVAELHLALASFRATGEDGGHLALADEAEAKGRAIVKRRHGALHDGRTAELTTRQELPTIYQFGYLYQPDSLCLWARERILLRHALFQEKGTVPGCAL